MADSSLDDFFAKKDKTKKSKNKSKFTSEQSSGLGTPKKLDEIKKSDKSSKRDKERGPGGGGNQNQSTPQFENQEWKDVVEEAEKDYSGLRIQALSINDPSLENEYGKDPTLQEGDEEYRSNEGPQGPWKLSAADSTSMIAPEEEDEQEPEVKPESVVEVQSKQPQKYVPPHRTSGGSAVSSTPNSYSSRRYGKSVPEMDSELHFPSLSAVSDSDKKGVSDNDKSFQNVTRGYKTTSTSSQDARGVQLDLGNKYSALRHN